MILAEDVRILQITGISLQWSGGEVSPRAGSTFPVRECLDLGSWLSELRGWWGAPLQERGVSVLMGSRVVGGHGEVDFHSEG